jgi:hypothetical protein
MHGQFWAIWLLKNSSQAISEYSYCENVYPTFALWRKYPISYQNFRICPHSISSIPFQIFISLMMNLYWALFLHQIYRKWIQQCLQTIKLFRNVQKTFFTLVFSALFCINPTYQFHFYWHYKLMCAGGTRITQRSGALSPFHQRLDTIKMWHSAKIMSEIFL